METAAPLLLLCRSVSILFFFFFFFFFFLKKKKERYVHHPSLRALGHVADGIGDAGGRPDGAEPGRVDGEAQARDEQAAEEGGEALGEVGVGALGCCFVVFGREQLVSKRSVLAVLAAGAPVYSRGYGIRACITLALHACTAAGSTMMAMMMMMMTAVGYICTYRS